MKLIREQNDRCDSKDNLIVYSSNFIFTQRKRGHIRLTKVNENWQNI